MILFRLFFTFLKIGAVSFGGGYGMIALIREDCLRYGWLTEEELLQFIAVAESTPGPIAINMATFVGASQRGVLGALLATLGVVLPSFVIILLIAALLKHVLKYAGVQAVLGGIRPAIAGMILATALAMLLRQICNLSTVHSHLSFSLESALILGVLLCLSFGYRKWKKKPLSPILLILLSGGLGILLYGI